VWGGVDLTRRTLPSSPDAMEESHPIPGLPNYGRGSWGGKRRRKRGDMEWLKDPSHPKTAKLGLPQGPGRPGSQTPAVSGASVEAISVGVDPSQASLC